ncbi:unnamed protein product [Caenorhabditis angaria]|uniref:Uncharacterized protein n=1 Tax=Caenorhabditis angaria TaxID=860376 RepID=A0A9P1MTK2_9PELO|nr:unnamed protein product [Caenorhabditis angaria]
MSFSVVEDEFGYRTEYEELTIYKMVIVFGGAFWAIFVIGMGAYNYLCIKKPPPMISFEEQIGGVEGDAEANTSKKSVRSSISSKTK